MSIFRLDVRCGYICFYLSLSIWKPPWRGENCVPVEHWLEDCVIFVSYSWEIVGNTRLRDMHQNSLYFVWQKFSKCFSKMWNLFCFLFSSQQNTETLKSNSNYSNKTINCTCKFDVRHQEELFGGQFTVRQEFIITVCLHKNDLWQFESKGEAWKSTWIKLCNYLHMFTVHFSVKHQDHCLPCSSRFFMQADIQDVSAAEEPMNNAGLAENLSYREKPLFYKRQSLNLLLCAIHDSAHLWKSIDGEFPGKPFQMRWKQRISCLHITPTFILLLHLLVCL